MIRWTLAALFLLTVTVAGTQPEPVTIRAARVLDGRGAVFPNAVVEVRGSKITRIDERAGSVTYDLGNATLLPGMIDVHVHLNWHFGPHGRFDEPDELAGYAAEAIIENARKTLMAGFTTVQSLGAPGDRPLRNAIASGVVVGPRVLTSIRQIIGDGRTPGELRDEVRGARSDGADVIKFFASGGIRDGGRMNVTQAQADAVCGEAKALGLRSLVHAQGAAAIIASINAGCTEIEHGFFADDAAIKAMADAHVYFDPNIGLVLQNYLENRDRYSGSFNAEEFASMERVLPTLPAIFRKALAAGLKMPLGTDAVAGAHGQNAREIVARVAAGQKPMDAIISATSLAAESLRLDTTIGTIAPGYEADIVAVPGDPLKDIGGLRKVSFVMKGGQVYKK